MTIANKKAGERDTEPKSVDAITLLRADHRMVSSLFADFEKTRSAATKRRIIADICKALTVHAKVEEEIFYPAVKIALKDKELVPEAIVEHATLKALVSQVEDKKADGEMFEAMVKVLSEYVKHHVAEEQNEMFPKAKRSRLDMIALGNKLAARKKELLAKLK